MGLLDKLWDDTVAGPRPETGLGRLRKFSNFIAPRIDTSIKDLGGEMAGRAGEDSPEELPRVTRSIMIKRPAGSPAATPPESPASSTPPLSPFLGGSGRREWNRYRRKSTSDAYERRSTSRGGGEGETGTAAGRPTFPPFEV
ncbi:dormancy-associated protein homolog 3-like [Wolffia australiana]